MFFALPYEYFYMYVEYSQIFFLKFWIRGMAINVIFLKHFNFTVSINNSSGLHFLDL